MIGEIVTEVVLAPGRTRPPPAAGGGRGRRTRVAEARPMRRRAGPSSACSRSCAGSGSADDGPPRASSTKLTIDAYADQEFKQPAGPTVAGAVQPDRAGVLAQEPLQHDAGPPAPPQPQRRFGGGEPDEVPIDLFFDGTGVVEASETRA